MTEQDALNKWCPYTRKYHNNGSFNRTEDSVKPGGTHCIGSRCMMWRWVKDELTEFVTKGESLPEYKGEHGYCGLAGPL